MKFAFNIIGKKHLIEQCKWVWEAILFVKTCIIAIVSFDWSESLWNKQLLPVSSLFWSVVPALTAPDSNILLTRSVPYHDLGETDLWAVPGSTSLTLFSWRTKWAFWERGRSQSCLSMSTRTISNHLSCFYWFYKNLYMKLWVPWLHKLFW